MLASSSPTPPRRAGRASGGSARGSRSCRCRAGAHRSRSRRARRRCSRAAGRARPRRRTRARCGRRCSSPSPPCSARARRSSRGASCARCSTSSALSIAVASCGTIASRSRAQRSLVDRASRELQRRRRAGRPRPGRAAVVAGARAIATRAPVSRASASSAYGDELAAVVRARREPAGELEQRPQVLVPRSPARRSRRCSSSFARRTSSTPCFVRSTYWRIENIIIAGGSANASRPAMPTVLVRDVERERERAGDEVVRGQPAEALAPDLERRRALGEADREREQADVDDHVGRARGDRARRRAGTGSSAVERRVDRGAGAGRQRELGRVEDAAVEAAAARDQVDTPISTGASPSPRRRRT